MASLEDILSVAKEEDYTGHLVERCEVTESYLKGMVIYLPEANFEKFRSYIKMSVTPADLVLKIFAKNPDGVWYVLKTQALKKKGYENYTSFMIDKLGSMEALVATANRRNSDETEELVEETTNREILVEDVEDIEDDTLPSSGDDEDLLEEEEGKDKSMTEDKISEEKVNEKSSFAADVRKQMAEEEHRLKSFAEQEDADKKIHNLELELTEEVKKSEELKSKLEAKESEVISINNEFAKLKYEEDFLKATVARLQIEKSDLISKVELQDKEITKERDFVKELTKELEELRSELLTEDSAASIEKDLEESTEIAEIKPTNFQERMTFVMLQIAKKMNIDVSEDVLLSEKEIGFMIDFLKRYSQQTVIDVLFISLQNMKSVSDRLVATEILKSMVEEIGVNKIGR